MGPGEVSFIQRAIPAKTVNQNGRLTTIQVRSRKRFHHGSALSRATVPGSADQGAGLPLAVELSELSSDFNWVEPCISGFSKGSQVISELASHFASRATVGFDQCGEFGPKDKQTCSVFYSTDGFAGTPVTENVKQRDWSPIPSRDLISRCYRTWQSSVLPSSARISYCKYRPKLSNRS